MPGPAARPKEVRREETTRRLLPVVDELLQGGSHYSELHVEQIIAAAGMARSTFYSYYDDKSHLLRQLSNDIVTELAEVSMSWTAMTTVATRDDLRVVMCKIAAAYRDNGRVIAAITEESMRDSQVRHEFHRLHKAGHRQLLHHIQLGQEQGWVHTDVDADTTTVWLLGMLERGLYEHLRATTPDGIERHVDALTGIIWRALYAGATAAA